MAKRQQSLFDSFSARARQFVEKKDDPHLPLWKKWDEGGRKPEHLEPLLNAFEPDIQRKAQQLSKSTGGNVPLSFLEGELRIQTKKGLERFDPNGGTKLRNWIVYSQFPAVNTPLAKARNFAYVPKNRVDLYQRFHNAKNEFLTEHGHEPTIEELKLLLPDIPERTLKPLMTEFRKEHFIGGHPDPDVDDSPSHAPSQVRTIISLMPTILSPEEKKVFDHLFPQGTETPASIAQIAKKTGLTQNQVYRVRAEIYNKVKPHLKGI